LLSHPLSVILQVMSDVWVYEPRKMPHRCRRSGRHAPADGPYFEDSVPYTEAPGDDRELTQYISVGWLKTIAKAPGSPIDVIAKEELETLRATIAAQQDEIAELELRLEEAREPQVVVSPIDEKALADVLILHMDDRYSRKPGPKPRAA
jgi:hypothetical protein